MEEALLEDSFIFTNGVYKVYMIRRSRTIHLSSIASQVHHHHDVFPDLRSFRPA
jgi:hypothetical protein